MASAFERITGALSALGKRKAAPEHTDSPTNKRVLFRPWDQHDMHRRLETYRPLTWFAKPDIVSPVACASRGWFNEARDQLCCEVCHARLIYPQNMPFEARQRAADMFAEQLVTRHEPHCPWRRTCCDATVLAFNPAHQAETASPEALQGGYINRLNKLERLDQLPDMHEPAVRNLTEQASSSLMEEGGPVEQPTPRSPGWGSHCLRKVLALPAPGDVLPSPVLPTSTQPPPMVPGFDPTVPIVLPKTLNMSQKARLLSLLGWDAEELPAGSGGFGGSNSRTGQPVPYRPTREAYTLAHLLPPTATTQQGGAGSQPHGGAQRSNSSSSSSSRWSMDNVVLNCPSCKSRVGLWNFIPPQPTTPLLALPAPPPPSTTAAGDASMADAAAQQGGGQAAAGQLPHSTHSTHKEDEAADMEGIISLQPAPSIDLGSTIAGGSFDQSLRASGAKFGSGEVQPVFGNPAAMSQPVYGLQAVAFPAGSTTAPPAHLASAAGGGAAGAKRKAPSPDVAMSGPVLSGGSAGATTQQQQQQAGAAKRQRVSSVSSGGSSSFDPLSHHRNWCPWVFTGDVPGGSSSGLAPAAANGGAARQTSLSLARQRSRCGWMHLLDTFGGEPQQQQQAAAQQQAGRVAGQTHLDAHPGPSPGQQQGLVPQLEMVGAAAGGSGSARSGKKDRTTVRDNIMAALRRV